jgi:hypothetical protein
MLLLQRVGYLLFGQQAIQLGKDVGKQAVPAQSREYTLEVDRLKITTPPAAGRIGRGRGRVRRDPEQEARKEDEDDNKDDDDDPNRIQRHDHGFSSRHIEKGAPGIVPCGLEDGVQHPVTFLEGELLRTRKPKQTLPRAVLAGQAPQIFFARL